MISYVFIGFMIMFFIDLIITLNLSNPQIEEISRGWGWRERIMGFILWPLVISIFIWTFFINKDNNEKE